MILISIGILMILILLYNKNEHFTIKKSNIQGVGIFADKNYKMNEKILKAINNDKTITYLGSKINHCNIPNTYLIKESDGWYIYSNKYIYKDQELLADYNDTPDFIMKPNNKWKC
jgi:hypothetical protein